MAAVIEIRTYRALPGKREKIMSLLAARGLPVQRDPGMRVLGPFGSAEDEDTFVWLRAFPDEASRQPMRDAFYQGEPWLNELEGLMMPLIADSTALVVEDSAELWQHWARGG
ncbi:MAG: NIPSNAP family protein [Candidatus Dormiibacterota bacterium]